MAKRWHVKWDETEIPDGDYVRAADYDRAIAALQSLAEEVGIDAAHGIVLAINNGALIDAVEALAASQSDAAAEPGSR